MHLTSPLDGFIAPDPLVLGISLGEEELVAPDHAAPTDAIAAVPERPGPRAVERREKERPDPVGCGEDRIDDSRLVIRRPPRLDLLEIRRCGPVEEIPARVHEIWEELVLRRVQPVVDEAVPRMVEELVEGRLALGRDREAWAFEHPDVETSAERTCPERD